MATCERVNIFIYKVTNYEKPIIISTEVTTSSEVGEAVQGKIINYEEKNGKSLSWGLLI